MENDFIFLKRIRDILFFIFCTCLMLFLSLFIYIDCYALAPGDVPTDIFGRDTRDNSLEYYNKVNNGYYIEPRDAGNVIPYFNYQGNDMAPGLLPTNFHPTFGLNYYYNGSFATTTPKTINFSIYVIGYSVNDNGVPNRITNNWNMVNELTNYPRIASVTCTDSNGLTEYSPTYDSWTNEGNGLTKFNFTVNVNACSTFYFFANPYSSVQYRVYNYGIKINSVENWNGVLDANTFNNTINSQTDSLINNQNNNTEVLRTEIGGLPGRIINGLSSFFQSIITAIGNIASSIWSLFSGSFTTLFNWLSDIFDTIQNIFDDDTPTSQYITDYLESFVINSDNIILEFVTLPIQFLTSVISSTSCSVITLGSLFSYNLTLPCLRGIISGILGTDLYNIVVTLVTLMIYWRLCVFVKSNIDKVLELSLDINDTFNINL